MAVFSFQVVLSYVNNKNTMFSCSVRAVGEYATQHGYTQEQSMGLVSSFLKELEGLDYELFDLQRRNSDSLDVANEKLKKTLSALDGLLGTVPQEVVDKATRIINEVSGGDGNAPSDGEVGGEELKKLGDLLL